jgi:hypothetical protein
MEKALALSLLDLENDIQNESRKSSNKEAHPKSPRRTIKKSTLSNSTIATAERQQLDINALQSRTSSAKSTDYKAEFFSPRRISPKKVMTIPTTQRRAFNTIEDALGEYDKIILEESSFRDLEVDVKDISAAQMILPLTMQAKSQLRNEVEVDGPSQSVSDLLLQYEDIAFSDEQDNRTSLLSGC